jgi:RNA polymerase-binding transcription factor DksA
MTELSAEQLQELSSRLNGKRDELGDLIKTLGEVTGTKHDCAILDMADSANLFDMQRRAATLINQHQETVAEVEAALVRIKAGRYGLSETTGDAIAYERLLIIPWARTGVND